MIRIEQQGDFKKTKDFLKTSSSLKDLVIKAKLDRIAKDGVKALSEATPKRTGKTAESWTYNIVCTDEKIYVNWNNTNVVDHVNIAFIIQNGHYTRNGGYVPPYDYINPALKSIFDKLENDMWKAVTSV